MHDGCVLCGGTGVGKSHTAVEYYLRNHVPKTVYVITSAKKRDSQDWQYLFGDVGMTSNPEVTPGALVYVDSWENIKKYEEVTDAFFIFDEQRLVGSGRWVKAFYKIAAANKWIMLSATPGDNWLDYVPLFRANGFIKNLTQFKEDHVISRWTGRYYQVTGYRQVGRLVRWRNQLLVDMPYEKHTTRHTHEVAVEYDKDLVRELVTKRWHVYEERPLTDASELFRVMRRVVYTDPSRLEAVRRLLTSHPKLIVFYSYNYELEMLRTLNIPPTQIMKMPDGIVQLGPSKMSSSEYSRHQTKMERSEPSTQRSSTELKPSSSSSTSMRSSSPRTQHATLTEPETASTSDGCSNPTMSEWDYLLSPEGMWENARLSGTSTETSPSTPEISLLLDESGLSRPSRDEPLLMSSRTSQPGMVDHTTDSSETSTESLSTSGSPTQSTKTETLKSYSSRSRSGETTDLRDSQEPTNPSGATQPSEISSESTSEGSTKRSSSEMMSNQVSLPASTTTAVPATQETSRVTSVEASLASSTSGETTQQTQPKESSKQSETSKHSLVEDGTRFASHGARKKFEPSSVKSSPTTRPMESTESSIGETECQTTHDPTQTKSSSTTTTEKESRSSGTQPSGTRSESDTSLSEVSPKTSTTRKSSAPSRRSPAPSGPGSDSTSSPQFQVAEWNGHKHEAVPTTTSWVYLVQYVAGAEAWECIETDAMCFFSMPYSYKLWWQAYGRIDRLNTPFDDLHYYVLYGDSMLEKGVAKALETKKSFNESAFASEIGW